MTAHQALMPAPGGRVFSLLSSVIFAGSVAAAIVIAGRVRSRLATVPVPLPSDRLFIVLAGCTAAYVVLFTVLRPPNFSLAIVVLAGFPLLAGLSFRELMRVVWRSRRGVPVVPWLANLGLVLATLVFCAGMLEAGLRIYNPFEFRLRGDKIILPHHKSYVIEDERNQKLEKRIVHTKNSLGFRGPEPPIPFDKALSVLAVGGSTTECFFVSDGQDWPAVISRLMKPALPQVWVNNAGLDGHSTFGHLILIDDYVARMRPKVVLYLIGINDIGRSSAPVYNRNLAGVRTLFDRVADYSELGLVFYNVGRRLETRLRGLDRNWMQHREVNFAAEYGARIPEGHPAVDILEHQEHLAGYKQRVLALLRRTTEIGSLPVLITQPILWGEAIDPATGIDLRHGLAAWKVLEAYNDVLRQVGVEAGVPVIEAARRMPKDSALFYDEIHFTTAGTASLGRVVAEELCSLLREKFPEFAGLAACPH